MVRISRDVSRSLDEYLIHSGYQPKNVTSDIVKLGGNLREKLYMPLGWFSSAMQCVSNDSLGVALAQYGGCAVLPRSISIDHQVELGKKIKKAKAGFNYDVITVSPDDPISKIMDIRNNYGYSSFPVLDQNGYLAGVITKKHYHPGKDMKSMVKDRMIKSCNAVTGQEGMTLKNANDLMLSEGIGILPIVDEKGLYKCSVFWEDIEKHTKFPDEFVDSNGCYRFAGAISTFNEDVERAEALVSAKCDIIVVDTSDMKSDFGKDTIKWLRKKFSDTAIMAGNIIDEEGFLLAVKSGADVVKIGQGPGYACTTREVKRTGRGQATAFQSVSAARDSYQKKTGRYIPLCGDGGIEHTGHILLAYAMGMDFIMMGKYFSEFTESAGPLKKMKCSVNLNGKNTDMILALKKYWGEASHRANNIQRYGYHEKEHFVAEGTEGFVQHRGSIYDADGGIEDDINFVKKSLSQSGATNPHEFSKRVVLELQSSGSRNEGMPKV